MPPKEGKSAKSMLLLTQLNALLTTYQAACRRQGVPPLPHIIKSIDECMLELKNMSIITLRGPEINSRHLQAVLDSLAGYSSVKNLCLWGCSLGNEGLITLSVFLKACGPGQRWRGSKLRHLEINADGVGVDSSHWASVYMQHINGGLPSLGSSFALPSILLEQTAQTSISTKINVLTPHTPLQSGQWSGQWTSNRVTGNVSEGVGMFWSGQSWLNMSEEEEKLVRALNGGAKDLLAAIGKGAASNSNAASNETEPLGAGGLGGGEGKEEEDEDDEAVKEPENPMAGFSSPGITSRYRREQIKSVEEGSLLSSGLQSSKNAITPSSKTQLKNLFTHPPKCVTTMDINFEEKQKKQMKEREKESEEKLGLRPKEEMSSKSGWSPLSNSSELPQETRLRWSSDALESFSLGLSVMGLGLQVLVLDHNRLGNLGARILSAGLKSCSSLQWLSVEDCEIGAGGADALADVFRIDADHKISERQPKLVLLNVSRNPLGAEGLGALCEGLVHCESLKILNLSSIEVNGHSELTLPALRCLARVIQIRPSLEQIDLDGNYIGDLGAISLIPSLSVSKHVKKLRLTPRLRREVLMSISELLPKPKKKKAVRRKAKK